MREGHSTLGRTVRHTRWWAIDCALWMSYWYLPQKKTQMLLNTFNWWLALQHTCLMWSLKFNLLSTRTVSSFTTGSGVTSVKFIIFCCLLKFLCIIITWNLSGLASICFIVNQCIATSDCWVRISYMDLGSLSVCDRYTASIIAKTIGTKLCNQQFMT